MMLNIKTIFLFISILLVLGCNNSTDIQSLYPVKEVQELNEEIYFSNIWFLQDYEGDFYFNDYRQDLVIVVDSSLTLQKSFGENGRGPGEFEGAGTVFVHNDTLYVYDGGGMRLNVFTIDGVFERTVNLPDRFGLARFVILNNKIYLPSAVRSDSDMLILDLNGKIIREIVRDEEERVPNHRTIVSLNDQIFALNRATPSIERYSDSGDLLETFDLTQIGELEGLWEHYRANRNQGEMSRSTTILFEDVYIENSSMYVLCAPWPGRDDYSYIIKLSVDGEEIVSQNIFKIQGSEPMMRLFKSLVIEGDRLIAFEAFSKTIFEFNMSGS